MKSIKLDISKYIKKLEDIKDPVNSLILVSVSLADELKNILCHKEKLSVKKVLPDNKAASTGIWMWAIAVLSSA